MSETGTAMAREHVSHDHEIVSEHSHAEGVNGNGVLGKISKVTPLLAVTIGLGGGWVASQISSSVQSARQESSIVQLQAAVLKQQEEIEKLMAAVVPRQEHNSVEDALRDRDRWKEKYYDEVADTLRREMELRQRIKP